MALGKVISPRPPISCQRPAHILADSTRSSLTTFLRCSAFSLVEIVLALGIISFAFVALLGLLPVGLNTFNTAIDSTVQSQINQSLLTQIRQAKFSELGNFNINPDGSLDQPSPDRFYDEQGETREDTSENDYIFSAAVQIFYMSELPVSMDMGQATSSGPESTEESKGKSLAVVKITTKKRSAPQEKHVFTSYVANNGL